MPLARPHRSLSSLSSSSIPAGYKPSYANSIPAPYQFKKLLSPGKISQTLCLGNLTDRATYDYLRSISPDLKMVRGRMDVEATALPLTQVVTHGSIRIGFLEGFTLVSDEPDILLAEANRLDVDVLCWSGGTHRFECFEYMDKFFVNPGSATGAMTTNWAGTGQEEEEAVVPSFCLMDVSLTPSPPTPFFPPFAGTEEANMLKTGTRDLPDIICLPVKEGGERGGECGGREGHLYQAGRADRGIMRRAIGHRREVVTGRLPEVQS